MPKFQFRILDSDLERLQAEAQKRGVTPSDLGRLALEAYVGFSLGQTNRPGPRVRAEPKPEVRQEPRVPGSLVARVIAEGRRRQRHEKP